MLRAWFLSGGAFLCYLDRKREGHMRGSVRTFLRKSGFATFFTLGEKIIRNLVTPRVAREKHVFYLVFWNFRKTDVLFYKFNLWIRSELGISLFSIFYCFIVVRSI